MPRISREPGEGFRKEDVYEVWGDMVANAADAGSLIVAAVHDALANYFDCQVVSADSDGRPFLAVQWGDMEAHVDARAFGDHLDVYAILALRRGLVEGPDPAARIGQLEIGVRRDLQVFQTMVKRAVEDALEALDEGQLLEG